MEHFGQVLGVGGGLNEVVDLAGYIQKGAFFQPLQLLLDTPKGSVRLLVGRCFVIAVGSNKLLLAY